jgi:hypothetical protein
MVDSLVVTFSTIVTIDSGAFSVINKSTLASVVVGVSTSATGGETVVTLTFSGSQTSYGSLNDGEYQLTIDGTKVQDSVSGTNLDGANDGSPGSNYVFGAAAADNFFRLFGDSNGDRTVSALDLARFKQSYLTPANYLWYFDYNGDGQVTALDLAMFKLRYQVPFT